MNEKIFTVALILTIPADSYEEALAFAEEEAEGMMLDAGVGVDAIRDYEEDEFENRILNLGDKNGVVREPSE